MDCVKLGQLILQLRKEKGLTQREIAEQLNISNKTVSKWECGMGCPDVSLWDALSRILGADIPHLLQGELKRNRPTPASSAGYGFTSARSAATCSPARARRRLPAADGSFRRWNRQRRARSCTAQRWNRSRMNIM